MRLINVGFGNMVAADRVVAMVTADSAPIKRMIQDAKDAGRAIDVTCGRKTRAVIVTDSEHIILSAINPDTISGRLAGDGDKSLSADNDKSLSSDNDKERGAQDSPGEDGEQ